MRTLKQRELRLAFALIGLLTCRSGFAIGLGEIQKQSALGAPLNVEIELSLDGDESIESIHAKIADAGAYDQAGLERHGVLEQTSVDAIQLGGHTFLHVFSAGRVAEPYLPLLLEVGDARGKLLREYDLLLDPPSSRVSEPSNNSPANPSPVPAVATTIAAPVAEATAAMAPPNQDAENSRAPEQKSTGTGRSSRPSQNSSTSSLESKPPKKSASSTAPSDNEIAAPTGFARVVLNVPIAGPIATPSPTLALSQSLGQPPTAAEAAAVGARLINGGTNPPNPSMNAPAGAAVAIDSSTEKENTSAPEISSSESQNALDKTTAQPGMSHGFFYGLLALIAGVLFIALMRRRANNAESPETLEPKAPRAYARATNVIPPMDVLDGQPTAESVAASVRAFEARSAAAKQEELQSVGSDFFDNVAEFLQQAVTREPHRFDLRMKLLEVYYAAGNIFGFVEQARDYRTQARDAISDKQWPEIARMGREIAAGNELFAEPVETSRPLTSLAGARETVTLLHHRRYYEELDSARLEPLLNQLAAVHADAANDEGFKKLVQDDLREFMQRPSALQHAVRLSVRCGGAAIYLKRTDLHGARDPELINAIGQINLALCMGKKQVLAGTLRSGNHAIAVATVAAKKGLRCRIFISETALELAKDKLTKLRELGAEVQVVWPEDEHPVDPRRAAMQAWMNEPQSSLFISSLSAGPRPYPAIVLDFQTTVGQEVLRQLAEEPTPRYPDALIVDANGGFETFGLFAPFIGQKTVRLYSAKAINAPVETVVSEGAIVRQQHWQSLGRERAWLRETGRVAVRPTTYEDALAAVEILARLDGYNISIEDGYAVACAADIAASLPTGKTVVALLGAARE